jgi:hypothetical protein
MTVGELRAALIGLLREEELGFNVVKHGGRLAVDLTGTTVCIVRGYECKMIIEPVTIGGTCEGQRT